MYIEGAKVIPGQRKDQERRHDLGSPHKRKDQERMHDLDSPHCVAPQLEISLTHFGGDKNPNHIIIQGNHHTTEHNPRHCYEVTPPHTPADPPSSILC
jgi:hypothetical protein